MTSMGENKGNILVVDDVATSLQLLTSLLVKHGHEVRTANTGAMALDAVHTAVPDLILLDIKMPGMDGYEICQRLKADERTRDIPIIFVSALEDPEDKVKGFAVGGVDYITKPIQSDEVLARVETHLALRNAQKELEAHNARLRQEIAERRQAEEGQRKALTETLQATHALRESEEKFRSIIEQANDGIVLTDTEGTIIEWNYGQERITGIKRDQALGQPVWNVLLQLGSEEHRQTIEVSKQIQHSINEFLDTRHALWMNQLQEREIERTDGERRFVQTLTFPIETAKGMLMGSVMRDTTKRKRAEEALKQANADLAARVDELAMLNLITQTVTTVLDLPVILDAIAGAMTDFFDAQGTVIALLDATQTELIILAYHFCQLPSVLLGEGETKKDSLVGLTLPLTNIPEMVKHKQSTIIPQSQTSPLTQPVREIVQILGIQCLMIIPLQARGKVIGFIAVATDQVDREFTPAEVKLAETIAGQVAGAIENARLFDEQQKAKEQALEAQRAAETANRAKSVFLANMSHELRTPLNAILGFTQLMIRDPEITAGQRENLKTIIRSGDHLLTLINDVLEMSKIEAGRTTLYEQSFDLHRLLDTLKDMFHLRATGEGLQLTFDQTPDVPRYVQADESKLRQVLINLLSNAVKFTKDGCVTLRVGYEETVPRLLFEVEDTGPGITPDDLEKLFDPFVQTVSGQESQEGTGLGLPISQRFVRLMGGDLIVTSPPSEGGQGSVFRFDVPIKLAEEVDVAAPQTTEPPKRRVIGLKPGQRAADGGPYRLLVVEDRKPNREVLVDLLAGLGSPPQGFEVRAAANGQEAIKVWEDWEPHLIWMDMRMPVMDGHEATKRIKATSKGQDTVIIALTASAFEEDRTTALSEGCDDFIRKPFREPEIFDKLRKHLDVRFIYEDEGSERQAVDNDQIQDALTHLELVERLAALPSDRAINVQQATILGDLGLILTGVDQIRKEDSALANALADLAHNFEHDKMLALIQEAKEHKKSNLSGAGS